MSGALQREPRTGGGLGAGLTSFQLPVATGVDPTIHTSRQHPSYDTTPLPESSVPPPSGTRPDLALSPSISRWVVFDQFLNLFDPAVGRAP